MINDIFNIKSGMDSRDLPPPELFDQFCNALAGMNLEQKQSATLCEKCGEPIRVSGDEGRCIECGNIQVYYRVRDANEQSFGRVRLKSRGGKIHVYNTGNSGYERTQKKVISNLLAHNQADFDGEPFPDNVVSAVIRLYSEIQYLTEDGEDGKSKKKFVRRGNLKEEVIAALIYFECNRAGQMRKKRDIARFMKLPTCGFSRGEDIIRGLQAEGFIDLPVDAETVDGFVIRYLKNLAIFAGLRELADQTSISFVSALVNESETLNISRNSQTCSKVAGAIWLLCKYKFPGISVAQIERATDNTKKTTFMRFSLEIEDKLAIFAHVFKTHNVALS